MKKHEIEEALELIKAVNDAPQGQGASHDPGSFLADEFMVMEVLTEVGRNMKILVEQQEGDVIWLDGCHLPDEMWNAAVDNGGGLEYGAGRYVSLGWLRDLMKQDAKTSVVGELNKLEKDLEELIRIRYRGGHKSIRPMEGWWLGKAPGEPALTLGKVG